MSHQGLAAVIGRSIMDIRAQTVGEQVETVNQEMPFLLQEITTKICTKIK
jgi:hypothetical protein